MSATARRTERSSPRREDTGTSDEPRGTEDPGPGLRRERSPRAIALDREEDSFPDSAPTRWFGSAEGLRSPARIALLAALLLAVTLLL